MTKNLPVTMLPIALIATAASAQNTQTPPASTGSSDSNWAACTTPGGGGQPWQSVIIKCDSAIAASNLPPAQLARGYYFRGNAHINLGHFAGAMADYFQTIKLDPSYAKAYANIGYIFKAQGNYQNAVDYYSKSIVLDAKNAVFFQGRGLSYARLKKWDAAILDFNDAIKLDPSDQASYYNRGFARYNIYHWGDASADFAQALKLDPKDADSQVMLTASQAAIGAAKNKQLELDRQYREAQQVRQAEIERENAAQLARQMLGIVANAIVAANQPTYGNQSGNASPTYSGGANGRSSAYASPPQSYTPPPQSAPPASGSRNTKSYKNPQTGQNCVTDQGWRMESDHLKRISFSNSCSFTFQIFMKAQDANTKAVVIGPGGSASIGIYLNENSPSTVLEWNARWTYYVE